MLSYDSYIKFLKCIGTSKACISSNALTDEDPYQRKLVQGKEKELLIEYKTEFVRIQN